MSKSDPDSAIFMEDTAEDVSRKIKKAYCEPRSVGENPILDYCKSIIFPANDRIVIKFNDKEPKVYTTYESLVADYREDIIGPGELKKAVAEAINALLQPVRDHFTNDPYARGLLTQIKTWQAEMAKKQSN